MNKNNSHLMNISHCLLELRNDDHMTYEEKDRVADTILDLLTALTVNMVDHGTKDEFKVELLKIIGWCKTEGGE